MQKKTNFTFKEIINSTLFFFFNVINKVLKTNKRLVPISFPFFSKQIVYDKFTKKFIKFKIRDYVDWTMVYQIFYNEDYNLKKFSRYQELQKIYDHLIKSKLTPLIIDCGGHIGLASKYFSIIYPESKIIYLEPEINNFELGKSNNFKNNNLIFLNKAIGSSESKGNIIDENFGNNAFKIEKNNNGSVQIISVNSILEKIKKQNEVPFIIKIDIEGFEKELFEKNIEWIDQFPILIIELHDWMYPKKFNSKNFLEKISKCNRDFLYSGENIFSISNNILFK